MENNEILSEDTLQKCNEIISWYIPTIKKEIENSQVINFGLRDISKLCSGIVLYAAYSGEICRSLQKLFDNKGIISTLREYDNGEKYLILRDKEIKYLKKDEKSKKDVEIDRKKDKDFKDFAQILKEKKIYEEDNKYLLCPICNRYTVEYTTSFFKEYDKKWWCINCLEVVIYSDYNIRLDDKDKYHIYKIWGVEALSILTNKSLKRTVGFVASYFKNCCVSKKDKCLYFDFFKENKEKEEEDGNIEGDINGERSKMGIVHRNGRIKRSNTAQSSNLEKRRSD